MFMNETLGETIYNLRTRRNLTVVDLADRADVPESLIYGVQTGSRTIGECSARKIGVALGLSGLELEKFILLALNNAKRRVLKRYSRFPAEVLNLLAARLLDLGISPERITRCVWNPKDDEPVLTLDDGTVASLDLKLTPVHP